MKARISFLALTISCSLVLMATCLQGQTVCINVPSAASGGIVIGNVVAGQSYTYQASGCVAVNGAGTAYDDPDGNESPNGSCSGPTHTFLADGTFVCPGVIAHRLVGKIGGNCITLGSSGSFKAPASGALTLYCNDNGFGDNSGSWNVCITPTNVTPDLTGQTCTNVSAAASGGILVGNVTAGQAYAYLATGCVAVNGAGTAYDDPNGIESPNASCSGPFTSFVADNNFVCPGVTAHMLVGKIGGACVLLGSSGTFTAPASGGLTLYCNDDNFSDNSGSWIVCVTPLVNQACTNVPASASAGITVGDVVAGQTYTYQASGCVAVNGAGTAYDDPNGTESPNASCSGPFTSFVADNKFVCPGLTAHQLVAELGGNCIALGSSGTFTAPASGGLTLYCNDDNFSDNSGSWNVCITAGTSTQVVSGVCVTVPAAVSNGVDFGSVIGGHAYLYQASGSVGYNLDGCQSDPDGQVSAGCFSVVADSSFLCPGLKAFSLVGVLNGQCIQLGTSGSFTPAASGDLVLHFNDEDYSDNSGSWNVCLTLAPTQTVHGVCVTVPAASSSGQVFGNVLAGQVYTYQASGCVSVNSAGTAYDDPDGNESPNGSCSGPTHTFLADGTFVCPGITAHQLVGQINGTCIPMGSSGTFTPPVSGLLTLYCNDNIFGDNSGSWTVCITPGPTQLVNQACISIPAAASSGVGAGNVVSGQTYMYQASGCVSVNGAGTAYDDPNGTESPNASCSGPFTSFVADGTFVCPGIIAHQLVGKIGGTCVPLGSSGSFTAPASGMLVLYCNDNIFRDNAGAWSVCITPPLTQVVNAVCTTVSAANPNGQGFGSVVAGQTYTYQASGCVAVNGAGTAYDDPDGTESPNASCSGPFTSFVANNGFVCPGVTAHQLVGKIGGTCVPLGSSGSFTAPASGMLVLYCNDDIFGDNSGFWNVCITPSGSQPTLASRMLALSGLPELTASAQTLSLRKSQKNSLINPLKAAQRDLNHGKRKAAVGQLRAFIRQITALKKARKLDPATADALVHSATNLIKTL